MYIGFDVALGIFGIGIGEHVLLVFFCFFFLVQKRQK